MYLDSYLHDLVSEIKNLKESGVELYGRSFQIDLRAFICDAPARSFMCSTVGHNALIGCEKCYQRGQRINNVTTFSTASAEPRTYEDFRNRKQMQFHKGFHQKRHSELELIGIDMITQFPLEPMHLIDLGVMRKFLTLLINRKTVQKIGTNDKNLMSNKLISLAPFIPREFQRKPRSLNEICRWKATEFRQFALYTGLVVLKGIVGEEMYNEYLLLHVSYRMLSSPVNSNFNLNKAEDMLKLFVQKFPILFGDSCVTFNVHNLLHLRKCVEDMGALPNFTAYSFENFMQELKKNVRKPSKILQQISNKYSTSHLKIKAVPTGFKRNKLGKIISFQNENFFVSTRMPDNLCCIAPFQIVRITGFVEREEIFLNGTVLTHLKNFFEHPVQSMNMLGICTGNIFDENADKRDFKIDEVMCKMMYFPSENEYLFIPLLHGFDNTYL
ncbi:PREDICTED: uncharacterized protein LOC108367073 isoform X2 [Rhagoletis zephyria]|uniref:uncharacterized protein LOC108367073 isoform X2 n=1 Tax=Rhagoletis zephyria TaxID=28612 RepID=UPI000811794E|nr:PREDICTED: uncharacterized protein LOC108367073 isoform X2 [Rhagoletis zephyria]